MLSFYVFVFFTFYCDTLIHLKNMLHIQMTKIVFLFQLIFFNYIFSIDAKHSVTTTKYDDYMLKA